MMDRLLASVGLMLLALAACSAAAEPKPKPFAYFEAEGGRVRDMAQVLSPETEQRLILALDTAQAHYGPQMGVVTVASLHNLPIEEFSLRYANAWGLGDKRRNDGLLLLVAPKEHAMRIEVGKGIETSFTDEYCAEVIEQTMLPKFRQGDLEGGITAGAAELIHHMREHPTLPANDNTAHPRAAKAA